MISATGSSPSNWEDEATISFSANDEVLSRGVTLKDQITGAHTNQESRHISGELSYTLMDKIQMVEKKRGDTTDGGTAVRGSGWE